MYVWDWINMLFDIFTAVVLCLRNNPTNKPLFVLTSLPVNFYPLSKYDKITVKRTETYKWEKKVMYFKVNGEIHSFDLF